MTVPSSGPSVHSHASRKGNQQEYNIQDTLKKHATAHIIRKNTLPLPTSTIRAEPKQECRRTTSFADYDYYDKLMALRMKQHELQLKILEKRKILLEKQIEHNNKIRDLIEIKRGFSEMDSTLFSVCNLL